MDGIFQGIQLLKLLTSNDYGIYMRTTLFIILIQCCLFSVAYPQGNDKIEKINREKFAASFGRSTDEIIVLLFILPGDCEKCVDDFGGTLSCVEKKIHIRPIALVEGQRQTILNVFKHRYRWKYDVRLDDSDLHAKLGFRRTTRVVFLSKKGVILSELPVDQFLEKTCEEILAPLSPHKEN
jgi:hypothetical protein